jgi:hypothetical protein
VFTEPLKVILDPRVKTSEADLQQQFTISKAIYDDMLQATEAIHEITVLRDGMKAGTAKLPSGTTDGLEAKITALIGSERGVAGRRGGPAGPANLGSVRTGLARIEHSIQNADAAPTVAQAEAFDLTSKPLTQLLEQWQALKKTEVSALNDQLRSLHLPPLLLDTFRIDHDVEDQIEIGDED